MLLRLLKHDFSILLHFQHYPLIIVIICLYDQLNFAILQFNDPSSDECSLIL
jgi:hypothetical protein